MATQKELSAAIKLLSDHIDKPARTYKGLDVCVANEHKDGAAFIVKCHEGKPTEAWQIYTWDPADGIVRIEHLKLSDLESFRPG